MKISLPNFLLKKDSRLSLNNNWLVLTLIVYSVFGFFFGLDNNQQYGCTVIENESIFTYKNVGYSFVSLAFFFAALIDKQRQFQILFFELLFWVFKLFYLKEGYAVGLTAEPLFYVVFFDTIGLSLRIIFLNQLSQIRIKDVYLIAVIIVTMMLRTGFFRYIMFKLGE